MLQQAKPLNSKSRLNKRQQQCFKWFGKGSKDNTGVNHTSENLHLWPLIFFGHTVASIFFIHLLMHISHICRIIKLSHMAYWLGKWALGSSRPTGLPLVPLEQLCLRTSHLDLSKRQLSKFNRSSPVQDEVGKMRRKRLWWWAWAEEELLLWL